ncbi:hypothetical protein BT69DRAFT_1348970 [Atractiella rhizophila]|nr:hypothetical protein BT69DRAFT_1348970 [Atractiella rhizophila]
MPYSSFYGTFEGSGTYYDVYFKRRIVDFERVFRVLDRKLCYTDSGAPIGDDAFPQLKLYLALTVVIWIQAERLNRTFSSATADPFVVQRVTSHLSEGFMDGSADGRLLNSQRPTSLPPQGVWPYTTTAPDLTLFTGSTGATATNPHPPNPPGSSQFSVPIWTLPEFDFQELPAEERYVGMTTEEAVSHALKIPELTVGTYVSFKEKIDKAFAIAEVTTFASGDFPAPVSPTNCIDLDGREEKKEKKEAIPIIRGDASTDEMKAYFREVNNYSKSLALAMLVLYEDTLDLLRRESLRKRTIQ